MDAAESELLMRRLAADPNVEYVEVDQLMHATLVPNDSRLSEQWGFGSNASINLPPGVGQGDRHRRVVAVIDTGYRPHADLSGQIVRGLRHDQWTPRSPWTATAVTTTPSDPGDYNAANECQAPATRPPRPAGTARTWPARSRPRPTTPWAWPGIAYNAKVQPIRVLGKCGGYTSDIADGMTWASGRQRLRPADQRRRRPRC